MGLIQHVTIACHRSSGFDPASSRSRLCLSQTIATIGAILCFVGVANVFADPPPGYYNSVDASNATTLRTTVHAVIDDHTRITYTSGGTDTWVVLEQADEDPGNPANIIDLYMNASYAKVGGGNANYDREHTWPNSYGFPNDGGTNYPYTDCHHLMLCNGSYNSSRSNKAYATCASGCTEKTTILTNGFGGGSGVYPGNSDWTSGSGSTGSWETWNHRRGDVARAMFYMDVRYEGGTHGGTGAAEPNLILTDNRTLIGNSNTGANESVAYMGLLTVLQQWHVEDPVDDDERARNDVVFSYQGNRNPFVDHPEWVDCLFGSSCGGAGPNPSAPVGLTAIAGNTVVNLNWLDNSEPDLDGYNVYRSTVSGGPYSLQNGTLLVSSDYVDTAVVNGTTYYYRVTAVDVDTNESAQSAEAFATPSAGAPAGGPWINEFHYDNASTDADEGIEIAGPAGTNLAGWTVVGYTGSDFSQYQTVNLSGTLPNQQNGYGTLWFAFTGLQNGAPDGMSLVDASNNVVQFLSYEGSFTASGGAASGLLSTDVGVSEVGTTPVGQSLQLLGTGSAYADFTWTAPAGHTRGLPNNGQTFSGPAIPAMSTIGMVMSLGLIVWVGTKVAKARQKPI